jgi:hypothetical protein
MRFANEVEFGLRHAVFRAFLAGNIDAAVCGASSQKIGESLKSAVYVLDC